MVTGNGSAAVACGTSSIAQTRQLVTNRSAVMRQSSSLVRDASQKRASASTLLRASRTELQIDGRRLSPEFDLLRRRTGFCDFDVEHANAAGPRLHPCVARDGQPACVVVPVKPQPHG